MRGITNFYFVFFIMVSAHLFSQTQPTPKIYGCLLAAENIIIDGRAVEPSWNRVQWSDDFADIEGDAKPVPTFRTRFKMLWDDESLYIFAELEEPHIWANLRVHDEIIFYDNDFEVFIDPDGDNHNYFELEVNALSTVFDLYLNRPYNAGGSPLIGWDIADLKCAVHIDGTINEPTNTDDKWTMEAAIPWKSLIVFAPNKRPPKQGEVWRMNFSRVQWKTEIVDGGYKKLLNPDTGVPLPENNWVWSPQGVVNMHLPEMWGYMAFFSETIPESLTIANVDPFYDEKLVLLDFYRQQMDYHKKNNKFAGSLYELNKHSRSSDQNIFIESTSKHFLISVKNENGNKVCIDHQKRIWVE